MGIGPGVLSRRLQDLEESGIVVRRTLPRPADVVVYDLTDWGRDLEEVNAALSRWAVRRVALTLTDSRTDRHDPVEYLAAVGPAGTVA